MNRLRPFPTPSRQRGAVLFVGLVLLILMALLGVAGMQSTMLQERMAGNYRTLNLAFQNTETTVRRQEDVIQEKVDQNLAFLPTDTRCQVLNTATFTATAPAATGTARTSRLNSCIKGFSSRRFGRLANQSVDDVYQVSGLNHDRVADAVSRVMLETVFIP
jgi:type IV pilus assembly protein PilX